MQVKVFSSNDPFELHANTYVVSDSKNNAVVIDPSFDDETIINYLKDNELSLKGILLTHGHFDHIRGVKKLVDEFNVPCYIHRNDKDLLTTPKLNCSDRFSRKNIVVDIKPQLIEKEGRLSLLEESIDIIETPYHTEGGICFYLNNSKVLFSGDSLFEGGYGRTDLPTSNPKLAQASLAKLMSLDDDVKVYPGHGETTFIKNERR